MRRLLALFLMLACLLGAQAEDVYQTPQDFLLEVFAGDVPPASKLWLTKALRASVRAIMNHDLGQLRIRYWTRGTRTAWILEDVGKEQLITTGLVVDAGRLADLRVLVYRESRGWEVKYPAFTDQFRGATLDEHDQLDRGIDGISGATLSVQTLSRLARLALLLDRHAQS